MSKYAQLKALITERVLRMLRRQSLSKPSADPARNGHPLGRVISSGVLYLQHHLHGRREDCVYGERGRALSLLRKFLVTAGEFALFIWDGA